LGSLDPQPMLQATKSISLKPHQKTTFGLPRRDLPLIQRISKHLAFCRSYQSVDKNQDCLEYSGPEAYPTGRYVNFTENDAANH
jgi:hypothetical protein